ncbi:hypothetical protein SMD27_21415 [Dongia soli]|uniref:Uncharacterized protein n=1 Tax=Dongia soli TaxID=600628 RepID=A0ABU5EHR4_9PROT|nr:hypothetical protein [Dongia soli]MDY0885414.1 hypothetical protein [Dongia soli]
MLLVDDDEIVTAAPAAQLAGENEPGAPGPVQAIARGGCQAGAFLIDLLLPRLHPHPQGIIDDAQMLGLSDVPLRRRVGPGLPLAGLRVLHVGATVPFQTSDVEGVVENPSAARDLAADGRVEPDLAARAGDAFDIQLPGDRFRRPAIGIGLEDPAGDVSFLGNDLALAALQRLADEFAGQGLVAVGDPRGDLSFLGAADLAELRLAADVAQLLLRHHAENSDMQRRDLPHLWGMKFNTPIVQRIVYIGKIREPPAKAIDGMDDDNGESLGSRL